MRVLRPFVLVLTACLVSLGALAQPRDYPTRQVTLIAPWAAGGAVDTLCRILGAKLGDRLGKPVVVENRPGAASTIGSAAVARAAPDGHTLVMSGAAGLAVAATLFKKLPYDPTKDFAPLALIAHIPFVLVVNPSLPVRSVPELVALAKARPGELSYASGGPGSPHHLFTELFKTMTGITLAHIPYKGSAPALTDVVAGHVPLMFSDPVPALPLIREGKVRALGVSSLRAWPAAPDIPPIAETGVPGFEGVGWVMIVAPANTPREIVARLHAELKGIVATQEFAEQMNKLGMVPIASPPPDTLQGYINTEIVRWGKVVQQAGIAGTE